MFSTMGINSLTTSCVDSDGEELLLKWLPLESPSAQLARCHLQSDLMHMSSEMDPPLPLPLLLHTPSSPATLSTAPQSVLGTPSLSSKRRSCFDQLSIEAIPSSPLIPTRRYRRPPTPSQPPPSSRAAILNDITNQAPEKHPFAARESPAFAHWNRQGLLPQHKTPCLKTSVPLPKVRRTVSECAGTEPSRIPSHSLSPSNGELSDLITSNIGVSHCMPCFDSPHDAIKRISPTTLAGVLAGAYSHLYSRLVVVDCRYPYEYHGGHLPNAINVCSLDQIDRLLFADMDPAQTQSTVVIFHCEFSSERAPRMALHVRNLDRVLNSETYPHLHYPQLYILDGGYKRFFTEFPETCDPPHQYVPMRNACNRDELRYHQRLKIHDDHTHGKHRHKLRSCSLRKSHSISMPHPVNAVASFFRAREPVKTVMSPFPEKADILSSDAGDICDQADVILQAAEDVLLAYHQERCVSK